MKLKEKCIFLGLVNYGGKQTKEFISLGYKGYVANGSDQDLKALGDIPKYHLQGFDGFGGHRERALDCLAKNSGFIEFLENIKEEIVFVIFGGGGSTGSGCAIIISELLLQQKDDEDIFPRIVCPVIALPSLDEPVAKHRNAYQAVQELQEIEGLRATFFINNNIGKDYTSLNSTFTKFLDTFLTNDSYGDLNNFDESERLEMLKDDGMMVISLMGTKEKDQNLDQVLMLQKLTKDGIFAPIENNKVCENIAIIHSGRNNSDIDKENIIAEVGKPKNIFEGYNGRSTLIAISGLDYPVSHVMKLGEMAKTAYEERQRNRKRVEKLGNLNFAEDETTKTVIHEKKKPSKWEVLQKKMKK